MKTRKMKMAAMTMSLAMAAGLITPLGVSADTVTEITWMHRFDEEGTIAWAEQAAAKFMEANPDVKVNVEMTPTDSYEQVLKTKIASDDAPMIYMLDNRSRYMEYAEANRLYDMTGLEGLENVDETMLANGNIDGAQYAIPLDVNAYGVHYNKAIFEEYGLEVPTTYSELRNVCEVLSENGITPFAVGLATTFCVEFMEELNIYPVVGQDPNWFTDKMALTSSFSEDEAFKEAVEAILSFKEYWGDDPFGTDWDGVQDMLANGEAAMLVNGSWTVGGVLQKNPDCNLGIFAMPTSEDPSGAILVKKPGAGLCIYNTEDEKKLDAAKRFMSYLISEEAANDYATMGFKMSTVKGVDFSFSEALMDTQKYEGDQIWTNAEITTFLSEYDSIFWEEFTNLFMEEEPDVDAFCEALDSDFAAISN